MKKFLTIPQKNSDNLNFDKLVVLQKEEKIKFDLLYDSIKDSFKISKEFISNNSDISGYTALITDDLTELILLQTDDNSEKELQPKFLKGIGVSPIFKSNWFKQLVIWRGYEKEKGFYLNKKYIEELDMFGYELSLTKDEQQLVVDVDTTPVTKLEYDENVFEIKDSYNQAINTFERNEVFS